MKHTKRVLALFLAMCMAFTSIQLPVNASETTPVETTVNAPEDTVIKDKSLSSNAVIKKSMSSNTVTFNAKGTVANDMSLGDEASEIETYANGKTTYVLAGSDFQPTDGSTDTGVNLVSGILDKIYDKYQTMDGFLFCGDYTYGSGKDKSIAGKNALQSAVQAVYNTGMDEVYIQGNHDDDSLVGNPLAPSGANDTDNYGVFVINEKDYMHQNPDNEEETIKQTAENLKTYLNAKRNASYTKPIFVMSHLPLHYCLRTQLDGDGKYANYIFDVLNEAGAAGLNIIFMFGHNHSHGWDDPYGGAAIFLTEDDKINIAQNSTIYYEKETLNFTYMNAGYVSYYRHVNEDAETDLSMTVFAITENDVTIERYTDKGLHKLKSKGVKNEHGENGYSPEEECYTWHLGVEDYLPDESTVASPYTLTLNTDITPAETEGETPGTGDGSTPTERTYTRVTNTSELVSGDQYLIFYAGTHFMLPEEDTKSNSSGTRKGFKIEGADVCGPNTITGDYEEKEWVLTSSGKGWLLGNGTQYAKLTDTDDYKVTATLESSGDVFTIGGYENAFTFISGDFALNHNDRGVINGYASDNNPATFYIYKLTDDGSTPTERTYTRVISTSELVSGGQYLIFYAGTHFMLPEEDTKSNSSGTRKGFKIEGADVCGPNTITGDYEEKEWVLTSSGKGWLLGNGTQYAKLTYTDDYKVTATLESSGDVFTIGGYENAFTFISGDFALNHNDRGVINGYASDNNPATFYIYKLASEGSVTPDVTITGYEVNPKEGTVYKAASQTAQTGAIISVQLSDGNSYTVPVTVGMLTNADGSPVSTDTAGTFNKLTLTYNNSDIINDFTLNVIERVVSNYPEYPDEGAVKVNKTATGINFQETGIAQVEISASGIPAKKGADVIVMLDTSTSMRTQIENDGKSRIEVLKESLENLITQMQAPGEDGELLDIRIAVADFNRYYNDSESPYYIRFQDHLDGNVIQYTDSNESNIVYTNGSDDALLDADAFVDVHTVDVDKFNLSEEGCQSGTNYDYAFDAIYQLGEAITTQNAMNSEERDLFVIFMSDGAPFQFNYFSGRPEDTADRGIEFTVYNNKYTGTNATYWNNWLTGTVDGYMKYSDARNDYYNTEGKHWMAEAIKGDPNQTYPVIRKNNVADTEGDTWVTVKGLGAKLYSIGFCLAPDQKITVDTMDTVIRNIASDERYYFRVDTASELSNAFASISGDIAYAATNARFVDQMGDDFELQMKKAGEITPTIEILNYDIYTKNDTIPEGKNIGDRTGTSTVIETVRFNESGTEAYSTQNSTGPNGETIKAGDNILIEDVIYANTFWYNTKSTAVPITGVDIPTDTASDDTTTGSTNELPAETFYWKLGSVISGELAMRYYVYLEGSTEGTKEAGSYPTNEFATLYYNNYLERNCYKDTISPVMAWEVANISYAFYLVNADGEIIVNQTTGETGSFVNKIAITNPVVYKKVLLNSTTDVNASVVANTNDVLPGYYTLYDSGAAYEVNIKSDATGSWRITKGNVTADSTYVTQYKVDDAAAYSNALTNDEDSDDYTHTIVWFAVVWNVGAHPDTVVIDYGLPVDISVLTNDMFGDNGKLAGVGPYTEGIEDTVAEASIANNFGANYAGTYGSATADTAAGKVRYALNSNNGMQMQTYEKFAYAVDYSGTTNSGYYYDTVTVIPATTIYYEDNFVTYKSYTWVNGWTEKDSSLWSKAGTTLERLQQEDRPGKYSLTDANNIYGYDSANLNMSTYSMGSAMKATVDYDNKAEASFEFYGTGFDVISMTNATTGTIYVDVYKVSDGSDEKVKGIIVDTYYGYKTESGDANGDGIVEDGEVILVVDPTASASIYQVPIIKIDGLNYGKYKAVIRAVYEPFYDNVEGSTGYDFYLDAIRIYDPTNNGEADGAEDVTIENAYKNDGEGWPSYLEVRDKILAENSFDNVANDALTSDMEGLVFIDGNANVGDAQISDYLNYGPNNEVYLAPGQRVAFMLNTPANIANVHIGIKSADGKAGTYTITNIAKADIDGTNIKAGSYYGARTSTVNTATEMYYNLTGWKNDIIVISNTGDNTSGVISITNIKSTYTSAPNAVAPASEEDAFGVNVASIIGEEINRNVTYMYMTPAAAALTLRTLNASDEEDAPDTVVPEEKPEVDTTVPEEKPEVDTTVPEEKPEADTTIPEEKPEADATVSEEKPETDITVPGKSEDKTPEQEETKTPDSESSGTEGILQGTPETETPDNSGSETDKVESEGDKTSEQEETKTPDRDNSVTDETESEESKEEISESDDSEESVTEESDRGILGKIIDVIINTIKNIFNWLFGWIGGR